MIIKSILDTDLYKFTTSYAYMKLFPQARGTFEFIDRDNTEYLRKTVYGSVMSVEELNELGAQGWILCAAVKMTEAQYNYLFYKHS